ncbi:MAG: NlpC/P60 family protein [Terracidiphilus sp.]
MKMKCNAVLSQVCFLLAQYALSCPAAAGQVSVTKPDYVVSRPVINMYHSASPDSDVVSQALYGSGVGALEKRDGWIHIRTGDDYKGWVAAEDVAAVQGDYAPTGKAVRVVQLSANIYREPDVTKHAPLLNLPWEARMEVLSTNVDKGGRWIQIKLVNGQTGYVERGNVSADVPALTIDQTIQLAHRFLGITYTWGGVSTYGYDCSGFMQMLIRQRGILMPRDADVQANWSGVRPVERKDLQPGDLLYFGGSVARITHTGMYIGNGEFIHDTTNTHPEVQISKLDDMPWTKLLVAARRVK